MYNAFKERNRVVTTRHKICNIETFEMLKKKIESYKAIIISFIDNNNNTYLKTIHKK